MKLANIRPATPEDYTAICGIYPQLDSLHQEHLPDRFQQPVGPVRERDFLVGQITNPKVAFLVAEAEYKLLGFVQATVMDTPAIPTLRPRRYVYIIEIVVQADYRGQGLGR